MINVNHKLVSSKSVLNKTINEAHIKKRDVFSQKYISQILGFFINSDYSARSSLRRRIISIADFEIRVPGPKIAATPALYKKS